MRLDRIVFIPVGQPPHKPMESLATAANRRAMVELAIKDIPTFELSDVELRRTGKSYSIDTVRELQIHFGPDVSLYFIIGLDAFLDLPSWKDAAALLRVCRFIVVSRPQTSFTRLLTMPLFPSVDAEQLRALDSGRLRTLSISLPDDGGLTLLVLPPCEVSASEIRTRVREGKSLRDLLPPSVESYIIRHRLYLEASDRTGT
jgi:nicotinate-nucleotide adenylyltransferase